MFIIFGGGFYLFLDEFFLLIFYLVLKTPCFVQVKYPRCFSLLILLAVLSFEVFFL